MNNIIKRKWNQNSMVIIEDLQGMAFQAESGGHTFQISGVDGEGNAVALSGTPAGVLLRADGQDVTLTCSVSGGVVFATLPANAYVVPGRFGLTIFLTSDGQKTAIYAAVGTVGKTSSGTVAPPAGSDVVTLVNAIAAAVATIPASYTDLMASVAPTYSSSGLYAVGSYAWYSGKLYRCTTAITTAETWTAAHWTLANLGSDLVDLKSALTNTTGNEIINITQKNKFIDLSGETADIENPTSSLTGYCYSVVACEAGDVFTINAVGGTGARAWGFLGAVTTGTSRTVLAKAGENATASELILTAPTGATYLVINDKSGAVSYHGEPIKEKESELKNTVDNNCGNTIIELKKGLYIPTNIAIGSNVDLSSETVSVTGMGYAVEDCLEGDQFEITGTGGNTARLWAFIDSSGKVLSKAEANETATHLVLTAPENAAKIIINIVGYVIKGKSVGAEITEIKKKITEDRKALTDVADKLTIGYKNCGLNPSTGEETESTTRVTSVFIKANNTRVENRDPDQSINVYYFDNDKEFITNSYTELGEWVNTVDCTHNGFIRIVVRNNDNSAINRNDVELYITDITTKADIDPILYGCTSKEFVPIESGGYNGTTGEKVSSNSRVRTKSGIEHCEIIKLKEGFICAFIGFDSNDVFIGKLNKNGDCVTDTEYYSGTIDVRNIKKRASKVCATIVKPDPENEGQSLTIDENSVASDVMTSYYHEIVIPKETKRVPYYYLPTARTDFLGNSTSFADYGWSYQDLITNIYEPMRANEPRYITRENIGKDASGIYDMWCYIFTPENYEYTVYMQGGIHGINEFNSYLGLARIMWLIVNNPENDYEIEKLRRTIRFIIVPVVNVWNVSTKTKEDIGIFPDSSNNSNNVNLNREWTKEHPEQEIVNIKTNLAKYAGEITFGFDLHTDPEGSPGWGGYLITYPEGVYDFFSNRLVRINNYLYYNSGLTIKKAFMGDCKHYPANSSYDVNTNPDYPKVDHSMVCSAQFWYDCGFPGATLEHGDYKFGPAGSEIECTRLVELYMNHLIEQVRNHIDLEVKVAKLQQQDEA